MYKFTCLDDDGYFIFPEYVTHAEAVEYTESTDVLIQKGKEYSEENLSGVYESRTYEGDVAFRYVLQFVEDVPTSYRTEQDVISIAMQNS